jgi:hypothetical protein
MSGIGSGKNRTQSLVSKDTFFNMRSGQRGTSSMSTGRSTAIDGNVIIDPRIREIQEQGLSRNSNLYNQLDEGGREIMGNLRGTRSRYEGNRSAYMESQLNPVQQEYATRQGGLERNIGLRGLSGSSFGQQSLDSFATEKNRGISDARAKAEFDQLAAVTGIDSQMASTLFNRVNQQVAINGMDNDTAKAMLAQELSALGVGQAQINTMVQAYESQQNRAFQERKAIADTIVKGFGK